MERKLFVIIALIWTGWTSSAAPTLQIIPSITTVITRITNNTIDVLHGVSGVVQGGVSMLSSTVNRIIDGASTVRDRVVRLLEEFRKYMQKGIPELGIPILEPLTIDRLEVNIVSPDIGTIEGHATNVEIRRLSEFKIDYINWDSRQRLTLNLTFPRVDVKGMYEVHGTISKRVGVYGEGPFWLKLGGLKIGAIAQFRYSLDHDPHLYVERMRIGVKLKKLTSKFSNLMHNERLGRLYNEVISNVTPSALDMLWPDLEPGLSKQVVHIINEKLRVFQLGSIFERLLNIFNLNQSRINVHT